MSRSLHVLLALLAATATFTDSAELVITVTNNANQLFVDGVQSPPFVNGGDWRNPDFFSIDDYSRLIAIRGVNIDGGCSGIMATLTHDRYQNVTNRSWKCSMSAPGGWQALGFDDSGWADAHEVAFNGQIIPGCPWIPLNFMSPAAYWIWTENHMSGDPVVSCRGYTAICDMTPCQNGGTCQRNEVQMCRCPIRFSGPFCETAIDECDSSPCQNGGLCHLDDNGYYCECGSGSTGVHCETDLTDCASQPCMNGATCLSDDEEGYTCSCVAGYTGLDCESEIDECDSDPCQNDATCIDGINSVQCVCAPGYTGAICDVNFDECQSDPCRNGATCVDELNGYHCRCHPGTTGEHCETGLGQCQTNPCRNGGTCILDEDEEMLCLCDVGWEGPLCEQNEDNCLSNPCQNGGTCVDDDFEYHCECDSIFGGMNCEMVKPHCGSIMKQSGFQPTRNFWALCEITIEQDREVLETPCHQLIKDINYYGDADNIIAMGGTFGCFPTKWPDEMPDGACVPDYNQDVTLARCLSCTHMGVCIYVPELKPEEVKQVK